MRSFDISGSRLERRKQETRKKIIEAAVALFAQQGFNDTTMEQIADKADVAKKTLYNHFPVKEAILAESVGREMKASGSALIPKLKRLPDTRSRIIQVFTKMLEMAAKQEQIFKAYFAYRMYNKFQPDKDQSIRTGGHEFLEEIVKLGQQSGELRTDLTAEAYSNYLEIVLAVIVTDRVRGKDGPALKKFIEENVDIFLDGVRDRGRKNGN